MPTIDVLAGYAICRAPPHQRHGNVYLRRITPAAIAKTPRRKKVQKILTDAARGAAYSDAEWSEAYDKGGLVRVGGKGAPNHPVVIAVRKAMEGYSDSDRAASKAAAKRARDLRMGKR